MLPRAPTVALLATVLLLAVDVVVVLLLLLLLVAASALEWRAAVSAVLTMVRPRVELAASWLPSLLLCLP